MRLVAKTVGLDWVLRVWGVTIRVRLGSKSEPGVWGETS